MNISKLYKSYHSKIIEEKIFAIILMLAIFTALLNILGNMIIGIPFNINIKWLFIILLSFLTLKYSHSTYLRFLYFLFIIFIFIPLGWFHAGGGSGSIGYLFLTSIAVSIIFTGKKRWFLFTSVILIFIILLNIYKNDPQSIMMYSSSHYYYDTLIQIPITLIVCFLFLHIFADAYNKEKSILEKYSEELSVTNEKLKKLSITDSLTGFYNRKKIFAELQHYIQSKATFCTLMLDIDNFKYINDEYGHLIGDSLIVELCRIIRKIFNPLGVYGRYGGDEFIIIIKADEQKSKELCDLLLELIHKNNNMKKLSVTISGGLVFYSNDMSILDLLKNSDQKLYKAKKQGKNQICH